MAWFAEHADLVIVLFDPNKLLGGEPPVGFGETPCGSKQNQRLICHEIDSL